MINPLSYTTTNVYPCDEKVLMNERIAPGSSCFTNKTKNKLRFLESKIRAKGRERKEPTVREVELLPTDGSEEALAIRSLCEILKCGSEVELLLHPMISDYLGDALVRKELSRFKTRGSRFNIHGTYAFHQHEILLKWSKVFRWFLPIHPVTNINTKGKMETYERRIVDLHLSSHEKKGIRCIGIPITITIFEDSGFHSVCVFVDMRQENKITIEYFDSGSAPPPKNIVEWMVREREDMQEKHKDKKVEVLYANGRLVHQTESTSCGIFVLIFIRKRLEGIPLEMFSIYKIPDNFAIDFRRHVYSS